MQIWTIISALSRGDFADFPKVINFAVPFGRRRGQLPKVPAGDGHLLLPSGRFFLPAGVLELVDNPDLGSGAARRMGSSPFTRTTRPASQPGFFSYL